jgi:hypothetical protein
MMAIEGLYAFLLEFKPAIFSLHFLTQNFEVGFIVDLF